MLKSLVVIAGVLVGVFGFGAMRFCVGDTAAETQPAGQAAGTQPAVAESAAMQPERAFPSLETHPYKHKPLGLRDILSLPAEQVRVEMMTVLAWGGQTWVEGHMAEVVKKYPQDQPLMFFQAVVTRSRFEVDEAQPQLEAVVSMDAKTPEGECAELMLKIDKRDERIKSINAMFKIADAYPEDLLIQWITAIACRTMNQNPQGCQVYDYMFKVFWPAAGPVLMHQTYANMLDATGQYEKALVHRQLALKMEPAGWSYQGLANTLTGLKKYTEADEAYAKAVELSPKEGMYWQTWGHCLLLAGRYGDAEKKFGKALELNPWDSRALEQWGQALEAEKNFDQALAMYRRAIAAGERVAYLDAARVLRAMKRGDEAEEMENEANRTGI